MLQENNDVCKAQQAASNNMNQMITTASMVGKADPTLPYLLKKDVSLYGIEACLLQKEETDKRPVKYANTLSRPPRGEQNKKNYKVFPISLMIPILTSKEICQ